jgi:penicillin-insensitive murein endopeptidase
MKYYFLLPVIACVLACTNPPEASSSKHSKVQPDDTTRQLSLIDVLYRKYSTDTISTSKGSVSDGSLQNGALMPFSGANFRYFDTISYLARRAFVNNQVKLTILETYDSLLTCSSTFFGLMECSNEEGGKLYPHRTHQNGLSVDFMVPILKNGKPNNDLNDLGVDHYFMQFDDDGVYQKDPAYRIDFNTIALHLFILQDYAEANNLKIDKVLMKIALKDNLFATPNGKKLRNSGMYFATKLTPLIDNLHDDHYHVDFKTR